MSEKIQGQKKSKTKPILFIILAVFDGNGDELMIEAYSGDGKSIKLKTLL